MKGVEQGNVTLEMAKEAREEMNMAQNNQAVVAANGKALTKDEKIAEGRKKMARWLNADNVKRKFTDVLNDRADGFISSLLALCNETPALLEIADPTTIITAALQAATLKLPINKNLGFAYIVPYKGQAQFQLGWKGYVQLAERTGQYDTIHAGVVYEGQIKDIDFITGKIIRGEKKSNKVIGYVAYIEMKNGFNKTLYMTREEMEAHATKYSQSYAYDKSKGYKSSTWSTLFDEMAKKTVLKLLIGKYGIMSIDIEGSNLASAIAADGAAIGKNGELDYIDNKTVDAVDIEIARSANSEDFEPTKEKAAKPNTPPAAAKAAEAPAADDNALEGMAF